MPTMKTVLFYTKPDCALCQKAERVLDGVQKRVDFKRITVDITQDDQAFLNYAIDIPVVLIDGEEHARHALDEQAFFDALRPS